MVAVIPFIAAILLSSLVDAGRLKLAILATGFVIMSLIHMKWVPLIPR
jgi:hypothetical protein